MASTATAATCALVTPALPEGRATPSPHCVGFPSLPHSSLPSTNAQASANRPRESWKSAAYRRGFARSVVATAVGDAPAEVSTETPEIVKTMAAGDAPAEVATETPEIVKTMAVGDAPAEVATETPEIVKTMLDAWDKVEDKYAVTSLGVAGFIALWGTTGMISAIDRLPLVPGVLEVVGIGYTGWFAYRNLIFKPDREALIAKIKSIYGDIIGSS